MNRDLSNEAKTLLAVARGRVSDGSAVPGPVDGGALLELAQFHRVLPDVLEACRTAEAMAPGTVRRLELLEDAAAAALSKTDDLVQGTARVIAALSERIPVLIGKGIYVCDIAPAMPRKRTMYDVDVFIDPRDVDEALRICAAHGAVPKVQGERLLTYRRHRGQLDVKGDRISLDLHWWLNNDPLHQVASSFDVKAVCARAVPATWRGISVLVPCPEDALILNALYMTYENWGHRLRMYMDHRVLAQAVEPDRALDRAREVSLSKTLSLTLAATASVTGFDLNGAWRAALPADPDRYPEAFAILVDGPGEPSRITRWALDSLRERRMFNRFFIRIGEYARVVRMADSQSRGAVLRTLVWPGRQISRFYLQNRAAAMLHPLALVIGGTGLGLRAVSGRLRTAFPKHWLRKLPDRSAGEQNDEATPPGGLDAWHARPAEGRRDQAGT